MGHCPMGLLPCCYPRPFGETFQVQRGGHGTLLRCLVAGTPGGIAWPQHGWGTLGVKGVVIVTGLVPGGLPCLQAVGGSGLLVPTTLTG